LYMNPKSSYIRCFLWNCFRELIIPGKPSRTCFCLLDGPASHCSAFELLTHVNDTLLAMSHNSGSAGNGLLLVQAR
jgi:hypothetical protein